MHQSSAWWEVGLSAALIVVGAAVIWDGLSLPPPSFEPLGPAAVPQAIALAVILLALAVLIPAAVRLRAAAGPPAPPPYPPCPCLAAAVFALTSAYVAVMAFGLVGYTTATAGFTTLAVLILERFRLRTLPSALAMGLILGIGLRAVFTQVFVVDLP